MSSLEKKRDKYSLAEKEKVSALAEKYKLEYETLKAENESKPEVFDRRRKKHVKVTTHLQLQGYISRAVRETYPSLADSSGKDKDFTRAWKMANRALEARLERKRKRPDDSMDVDAFILEEPEVKQPEKKFRAEGAGRKTQAPEVRFALFEWFIDVRGVLKGRMPMKVFR